mgnify:CR=1 FL=1
MSRGTLPPLDALGAFLERDVVPALHGSLKSELRAALKNLRDAEAELAVLPALLPAECSALLRLGAEALAWLADNGRDAISILLDQDVHIIGHIFRVRGAETHAQIDRRMTDGFYGTDSLIGFGQDVARLTGRILIRLQALARDPALDAPGRETAQGMVTHFYLELRAHAEARIPWQSVFPKNP